MFLMMLTAQAAEPAGQCGLDEQESVIVSTDGTRPNPGAVIHFSALANGSFTAPHAYPMECLGRIRPTPKTSARWSAAASTLTLSKRLKPGSEVLLHYRVNGREEAYRLVVTDPKVGSLALGLHQAQITGCDSEPLGEVMLQSDNHFSITFTPFETYRDYWGTYRYSPESGRLTLNVEGGNKVEQDADLDGTLRKDGDHWLFTGFNFGRSKNAAAEGCIYRF